MAWRVIASARGKAAVRGVVHALPLLLSLAVPVQGAEIRGEVRVVGSGTPAVSSRNVDISVRLLPLQGQALPATAPRSHQVQVRDFAFAPAYLTVRRGDQVTFVNRDDVFYHLDSNAKEPVIGAQLAKAGQPGSRATVAFPTPGTWHIFCHIHRGAYLRVDVVDTPYIQSLSGPGPFEFRGLAPGRWLVEVSTVGSLLKTVEAQAFTAPPPLKIDLPVNQAVAATREDDRDKDRAIQALFPR